MHPACERQAGELTAFLGTNVSLVQSLCGERLNTLVKAGDDNEMIMSAAACPAAAAAAERPMREQLALGQWPQVGEKVQLKYCAPMAGGVNGAAVQPEDDELRVLPCKHAEHAACMDQWLRVNKCCPICQVRTQPKRPCVAHSF